jgi:hypothetical protein
MAGWLHGYRLAEGMPRIPWLRALFRWPAYTENRLELGRLVLTAPERESP